jgi:hypothetical protein
VPELPAGFTGTLDPGERIVTIGKLVGDGHLVLTQLGLWVPEGAEVRRIGWHLVSKAVWDRSDGVVLQVRADSGTAPGALEMMASEVASRLPRLASPG